MPEDGPGEELVVWRESGPEDDPKFVELKVDGWENDMATTFQQLGIVQGDVLLVRARGTAVEGPPFRLPPAGQTPQTAAPHAGPMAPSEASPPSP